MFYGQHFETKVENIKTYSSWTVYLSQLYLLDKYIKSIIKIYKSNWDNSILPSS